MRPVLALALAVAALPACSAGSRPRTPASTTSAVAAASPTRKLIEMGWDEPDTRFMRRHIRQLERSPFDGVVFHVAILRTDGTIGSHAWECWGRRRFRSDEFQPAIDDLRATPFRELSHNFVRFNVTPGDLDWFDDFESVVANARLVARVAREAACDGILFDTEAYHGPVFEYPRQRDASSRSFGEYAAQARRRGSEVMAAFQSEFPRVVVFLTFAYSHAWWQSDYGGKPLEVIQYGLLPAFLDGMLEAAEGEARFVDGHELAYSYRDPGNFRDALRQMKKDVLAIVHDDSAYARRYSAGFGLWMDFQWRERGWNQRDHARNWFSPSAFERSLRDALVHSDEYVWIYTERPRWWTDRGGPRDLPAAYRRAVERARASR